jgi:hypothetical protein
MRNDKLKILYIGGHGRSGSTLLERVLGQVDGFVSVGELRHIWKKGFMKNELCGCGKPFSDCEFWQAVIIDAFGHDVLAHIDHIQNIKSKVDRIRHIPKLFFPWSSQEYRTAADEYKQILQQLYLGIKRVANSSVIVDASKDPSTPFLLNTIEGFDLHVLHLIRDSRAVGYSWQRKRIRPDVVNRKQYMATYSAQSTALEWIYRNSLIESTRYFVPHYMRMRYEDFATNPAKTLIEISNFVGESPENVNIFNDRTVQFNVNHTVAGNPFRFKVGEIEIKLDSQWESEMKRKNKWLITLWTFLWLRRYRYQIG